MGPVKLSRSIVRKSANKPKKNTQVGRRTEKSVTDVEYYTDTDEQIKILLREAPRLQSTANFNPKVTLGIASITYERTKGQNVAIDNIFNRYIGNAFQPRKKIQIRKIQPKKMIQPNNPIQKTLFDFNYTRVRQNKNIRYFFALKK